MDPNAARALEQLHAGDTAIVATQYSYLPSFFSLVIDRARPPKPARSSSMRFASGGPHCQSRTGRGSSSSAPVSGPAEPRAPFVGSNAAASVANFASRADGALIVGSLGWNPILRQLIEARDPGTPQWQPIYSGGETVRFLTGRGRPDQDMLWAPSRVLYLQHPSDPVAYLSLDSLWSPLEWMDEPRGVGVPPGTGWFPIVSAIQAAADLSFSAGLPSGFGHDYRVDYVDAFARVAPPEAWTDEDTARLEAHLAADTETAAGEP